MVRYFAHVDNNNMIKGWYADDVHQNIPEPFIEVSYGQWQTSISYNHNHVDESGITSSVDIRTNEQKQDAIRQQRKGILQEEVDVVICNPLRWESLTEEEQNSIKTYRQELLDITEQERFPSDVTWPAKPEVLN
tara:strand:+ start:584 stop:985 length:402 start_codon:yes stop_codon:yes gene_type:complete